MLHGWEQKLHAYVNSIYTQNRQKCESRCNDDQSNENMLQLKGQLLLDQLRCKSAYRFPKGCENTGNTILEEKKY
jgi:hypothetical protein